jgi:hypothetical protein
MIFTAASPRQNAVRQLHPRCSCDDAISKPILNRRDPRVHRRETSCRFQPRNWDRRRPSTSNAVHGVRPFTRPASLRDK